MKRRVLVVGAGGQAKIVVDALQCSESHEPVGYVDDRLDPGPHWGGIPVVGPVDSLPSALDEIGADAAIVSVGDNFQRRQLVARIEAAVPGIVWSSAIHPSAVIGSGSEVGVGVLMMAGAVINPGCVVGNHVHIDTRASLDHDSTIGSCASLAPTSATGGGCAIGECTAVGIGAVIAHGRTIGEHTVIGAGSTVVDDIPPRVVAYGSPARVVRDRSEGHPYL